MSTGVFAVGELEQPDRRKHPPLVSTHDAYKETQQQRAAWEKVRRAERQYAVQLRKIATQIGAIVDAFGADDPQRIDEMIETLHRYADMIKPWARAVSRRMLYEVARRDDRAWRTFAKLMGETISQQLNNAPLGLIYQTLMEQQVDLITSIPRDAANRVHALVTENIYVGARASEVAQQILATQEVSRSRANLIARTETARAASTFQRSRAEAIGSTHYVWRTVRDRRVRPLHRKLEGKVFEWSNPPITGENGERSNPGGIYNCRCIAEPILPRTGR